MVSERIAPRFLFPTRSAANLGRRDRRTPRRAWRRGPSCERSLESHLVSAWQIHRHRFHGRQVEDLGYGRISMQAQAHHRGRELLDLGMVRQWTLDSHGIGRWPCTDRRCRGRSRQRLAEGEYQETHLVGGLLARQLSSCSCRRWLPDLGPRCPAAATSRGGERNGCGLCRAAGRDRGTAPNWSAAERLGAAASRGRGGVPGGAAGNRLARA